MSEAGELDTTQTDTSIDQQDTAPAEAETAVGETEGGEQQPEAQAEGTSQAEPEDDPRFARQFATLARKERELREYEHRLKQAQDERQRVIDFDAAFKKDPVRAMQDFYGYDQEKLISRLVQGEPDAPDPRDQRLAQLEAWKQELDAAAEQQREQAQRAAQTQQFQAFQDSIKELVDSAESGDKYELVKATEEYGLVSQLCLEHWRQYQKPLPIDKAAALAEDYLLKKAQKVMQAKKLHAKSDGKKQASQTLTNEMRNAPQGQTTSPETDEDRAERAASRLRWL